MKWKCLSTHGFSAHNVPTVRHFCCVSIQVKATKSSKSNSHKSVAKGDILRYNSLPLKMAERKCEF